MNLSTRRRLALGLILCLLAVFAVRLVYVQIIIGPDLSAQARAERTRVYSIPAERGKILDKSGKVMATSVKRYHIGINQETINTFEIPAGGLLRGEKGQEEPIKDENGEIITGYGPAAAAKLLAPIIGEDAALLGGRMVPRPGAEAKTFIYLKKFVTPEVWRQVRDLGIPGVEPEEVFQRIYPNGSVAGNIIGFTQEGAGGIAGLEQTQDEKLRGTDGKGEVEIGRFGQIIPTGTESVVPAINGQNVHTTISIDLQNLAQQEADQVVTQFGAQWAAIAVEEVGTGNIIALADSGTVDPSQPAKVPEEQRGSRAVTNTYEPGSTAKLVTFASALDTGAISPLTPFTVPYEITMPNGQAFIDSHEHPTMGLTAAGVLAQSSNTGTVQIGDMVKDSTRYEHLRALGFGEKTGIELPGESAGILAKPQDWDGRQRYTIMFGQGMASTILQNTSEVSTIANGGVHIKPRLIDRWEAADGTITKQTRPDPVQAIKPETSQILLRMMEGVVSDDGTAPNAVISGYRVGGKTGTTQILDSKGTMVGAVASFTGVLPIDKPKAVISVVAYKPTASIFGTDVAVPGFKVVATATMRHLGVSPSDGSPNLYKLTQ
ncbi:MAG: penicillin-binding protein 2 [Actinomycetaceae bacterium]|nr:penicillin-binding protein 2 [Actinomycetaceae bacterium]